MQIHTFTFDKDKTYTIDLMSRDFDCWLRIADADGKTLAQDDDGGEGLNSRLRSPPRGPAPTRSWRRRGVAPEPIC